MKKNLFGLLVLGICVLSCRIASPESDKGSDSDNGSGSDTYKPIMKSISGKHWKYVLDHRNDTPGSGRGGSGGTYWSSADTVWFWGVSEDSAREVTKRSARDTLVGWDKVNPGSDLNGIFGYFTGYFGPYGTIPPAPVYVDSFWASPDTLVIRACYKDFPEVTPGYIAKRYYIRGIGLIFSQNLLGCGGCYSYDQSLTRLTQFGDDPVNLQSYVDAIEARNPVAR
jgi:hypothetical protein